MVVTRRPLARTTLAAGVLALLLGVVVLSSALSALQASGAVDAETRSDLLVLGVPEEDGTVRTVGLLGAVVAGVAAALELATAAGLLARRAWAREGALLVFGVVGLILLAVSVQGLTADPPAQNALLGLLLALGHVAVVVLALLRPTVYDVADAEAERMRRQSARRD